MKKKLFVVALAGILAFGSVIAPSLSARADVEPGVGEGKTTQYDGADKAKFQPLIDAMIDASKIDAFGKPIYTWTLPDLTDFINDKIPNMTRQEEESEVPWNDGGTPSKEKTVHYHGRNGDAEGDISTIEMINGDGTVNTENRAEYRVGYDIESPAIIADEIVSSSGDIFSYVMYHDPNALGELSSLENVLKKVDDPDVVNYMNTEREGDNSRRYVFDDGTSLLFVPSLASSNIGDTSSEPVQSLIEYHFQNHMISLSYVNGKYGSVKYDTHSTNPVDPTDPTDPAGPIDMYRLYNPNSGEHFYTKDELEKAGLVKEGWRDEGIGWIAPVTSKTPVYRLYNPNAGDHHYTMKEEEKDNLISAGWNYEGIGWYSDDEKTIPVYREYNPNAVTGTHNYTTDKAEHDGLVKAGWNDEGIGWYAIGGGKTNPIDEPEDMLFPNAKIGDYVTFGSYEQDNDLKNGSEPIEWQYIADRDGHKLLLSKYALDCKRYNESKVGITWENCTLRSWLNNDFYNKAFSASDRKKIVTAHNENPDSYELYEPWHSSGLYGAESGNATDDKVFLLSWTEARDYLDGKLIDDAENPNQKLVCCPTLYAMLHGVVAYTNSEKYYGKSCDWWLRSLGCEQDDASRVIGFGALSSSSVDDPFEGVRPAILID